MKESYTITEMPYLTRNEMIEIADDGVEWAYNRQLCSNKIRQLPYDPEIVYPVEEHFYHEHRWHQASETNYAAGDYDSRFFRHCGCPAQLLRITPKSPLPKMQ